MILENKRVITFEPGYYQNGQTVLGRMVVHDRSSLEAVVLPHYFNHSSFPSFRRQLSYFNFARLGKSRQSKAVYVNEEVIHLDDFLCLSRSASNTSQAWFESVTEGVRIDAVIPYHMVPRKRPKHEEEDQSFEQSEDVLAGCKALLRLSNVPVTTL
jgi:hypothetical protein